MTQPGSMNGDDALNQLGPVHNISFSVVISRIWAGERARTTRRIRHNVCRYSSRTNESILQKQKKWKIHYHQQFRRCKFYLKNILNDYEKLLTHFFSKIFIFSFLRRNDFSLNIENSSRYLTGFFIILCCLVLELFDLAQSLVLLLWALWALGRACSPPYYFQLWFFRSAEGLVKFFIVIETFQDCSCFKISEFVHRLSLLFNDLINVLWKCLNVSLWINVLLRFYYNSIIFIQCCFNNLSLNWIFFLTFHYFNWRYFYWTMICFVVFLNGIWKCFYPVEVFRSYTHSL